MNENCSLGESQYYRGKNAFGILGLICLSKNFFFHWIIIAFRFLPVIGRFATPLYYLLIVILLILSAPYMFKRFRFGELLFFGAFIILYALSALNPNNVEYLKEGIVPCLIQALPLFLIGICFEFEDEVNVFGLKKTAYEWFYIFSIIGIICTAAYYLYSFDRGSSVDSNSNASTYTMIPLCYLIFYSFEKKKILSILLSVFGFLFMIIYGIRTCMIVPIVMLFIMILLQMKRSKRKYLILAVVVAVAVILYNNFEKMLLAFEKFLSRNGISNRFFMVFHNEGLGYLSGREAVWQKAIEIIKDNVFGYGMFGDRHFYGEFMGYSHNLFLELAVDFGILIAPIIVIVLTVILARGFFATKNSSYSRGLFLAILCSEMVMLMVSGTYLVEAPLFFLIGFSIQCYRKKQKA